MTNQHELFNGIDDLLPINLTAICSPDVAAGRRRELPTRQPVLYLPPPPNHLPCDDDSSSAVTSQPTGVGASFRAVGGPHHTVTRSVTTTWMSCFSNSDNLLLKCLYAFNLCRAIPELPGLHAFAMRVVAAGDTYNVATVEVAVKAMNASNCSVEQILQHN